MDDEGGRRRTSGETRRRYLKWGRIGVTIAAVGYLASRVDPGDVVAAFRMLSWSAALFAVSVVMFGLFCGMVRWRFLLRAYGAIDIPSWPRIAHLYFVGHFYNTYAPGGVGGDVIRGVAGRKAFGELDLASATSGVAVVFIERVVGVSALLVLAAGAYLIRPIPGMEGVGLWAGLGLAAAAASLIGIAVAPRLAPHLPERLAKPLRALPRLYSIGPFLVAVFLSLVIHSVNIIAGHAIMHSLEPSVTFAQSAVLMPLIGASAFFPLTVGGAGVREAAFAALYGTVGVPEATAYAGSLSFWATQLISAAIGGIINLFVPLSGNPRD
ncbi:MAG: flippase-like domain-containing protein [Myxococcales bacterium]|nr:MAG: flippase-like domain-containing protein [Myxococcales bacterium]